MDGTSQNNLWILIDILFFHFITTSLEIEGVVDLWEQKKSSIFFWKNWQFRFLSRYNVKSFNPTNKNNGNFVNWEFKFFWNILWYYLLFNYFVVFKEND